ncbi:IclR family transcriptional regulator [Microbacterium sp. CPCC 204701]|uniref:IclR family transcriptional regulator n=1 Tax=Microbacterium sp. CPCC 204701 TaxID=2493084 RepID=UPI000FD930D9|nr:IclR family transcriptional regulator [Microbacterium sp. CPCC 204701]
MLGTVNRVGSVLDLFTQEEPEWGTTRLARRLGLAKSQAHEILVSMTAIGLLQRTPGARYRLGWRTVRLGAVAMRNEGLATVAAPWMRRLVGIHPELSAHLAVWDLDRAIFVGRQVGREVDSEVAQTSAAGSEAPIHCTSLGKVLAAAQSDARIDQTLANASLDRFTDETITGITALRDELARVRERGFATDLGELSDRMTCMAVPISHDDQVVAALGVVLPRREWQPGADRYLRTVREMSTSISRSLRVYNRTAAVPA